MNLSGLSGGQYKPLSPDQVERLHSGALSILGKTGMTFEPGLEEVAELLGSNGATLDMEKRIIKFSVCKKDFSVFSNQRRVIKIH